MLHLGLGGQNETSQQAHRFRVGRVGQIALHLRRVLMVALCLWAPSAPAENLPQPIRRPPVVLADSDPVPQSEPPEPNMTVTAESLTVTYTSATQPFSDAFRLFRRVEPGETLSAIGARYGVKLSALVHFNQLQDPNRIRAGDTLVIPLSGLPLVWPVDGIVSSRFGPRGPRFHAGIDIAAPRGTPVRAAAAGRVMISGFQRGYGRVIWLRHPSGHVTVYAHHERNQVIAGQWVHQGEVIARVGVSGRTTGPHLHFEVHDPDSAQENPLFYLPPNPPVPSWPWYAAAHPGSNG